MSLDEYGWVHAVAGLTRSQAATEAHSIPRGDGPAAAKRSVVEERRATGALPPGAPLQPGQWGHDGTERDWERGNGQPQSGSPRGAWRFDYWPKSVHWAAVQLGYPCVRSEGSTRVDCTEEQARDLAKKCAKGEVKRIGDRLAGNLVGDSVPSENEVREERAAYERAMTDPGVLLQDREMRRGW